MRTLIFGSQHGQGIARAIQETSEEELLVEHGALYPALQRLEERGWISAKWGVSSNNRKARFYSLTAAGRKQLVKETNKWKRLTGAIARISHNSLKYRSILLSIFAISSHRLAQLVPPPQSLPQIFLIPLGKSCP